MSGNLLPPALHYSKAEALSPLVENYAWTLLFWACHVG